MFIPSIFIFVSTLQEQQLEHSLQIFRWRSEGKHPPFSPSPLSPLLYFIFSLIFQKSFSFFFFLYFLYGPKLVIALAHSLSPSWPHPRLKCFVCPCRCFWNNHKRVLYSLLLFSVLFYSRENWKTKLERERILLYYKERW